MSLHSADSNCKVNFPKQLWSYYAREVL